MSTLSKEEKREKLLATFRARMAKNTDPSEHDQTPQPPEPTGENDPVVIHDYPGCRVTRYPDSTVIKSGRRIGLDERDALDLAAKHNLPVPRVYEAQKEPGDMGEGYIRMDYIPGQRLDAVWPSLSTEEKDSICQQLKEILTKMRSIPWDTGLIGSCSGGPALDCRQYTEYKDGPFKDEATFNQEFYFDLIRTAPVPILSALRAQILDNHRIVFSHGDIGQHNILVKEGRITGLIDWEYAGWYPEHWDYLKFFERPCRSRDWKDRANMIFPQIYEHELAYHQSILRWQRP